MAQTKTPPISLSYKKGFSLVELIIVIVIIGILSGAAYFGIQRAKVKNMNDKVMDDLIAISNSLEQYKMDHFGMYPVPKTTDEDPASTMNVLCYDASAVYVHDCLTASFRQGMIDNNLLGKRYLQEVPTDPRTGSRYVYGVSQDGKYFMVAGLYEENDGRFTARATDNLSKGFALPSLIRAFDGPNFVMDKGPYLPYSPDHLAISARLDNINGMVEVNGGAKPNTATLYRGDIISATDGTADIFFSDGSVSHLDIGTTLEIKADSEVEENTALNIITKIKLKITSGRIWSKVARLASASEFSIETTTAIAGVRGTEFGVDMSAGAETWTVLSGEVDVLDLEGNPTGNEILDGEKAVVAGGGKDVAVTELTGEEKQALEEEFRGAMLNNNIRPYILSVKTVAPDIEITVAALGEDMPFDRIAAYNADDNSLLQSWDTVTADPDLNAYVLAYSATPNGEKMVLRYEKDVVVKDENDLETTVTYVSAFSDPPVTLSPDINLSEEDLHPKAEEEGPQLLITAPPAIVLQAQEGGVGGLPEKEFPVTARMSEAILDENGAAMEVDYALSVKTESSNVCEALPPGTPAIPGQFTLKAMAPGSCAFTVTAAVGQNEIARMERAVGISQAGTLSAEFVFRVGDDAVTGSENAPYILPPGTTAVTLEAEEGAQIYQWSTARGTVAEDGSTAALNLGNVTGPASYAVTLTATSTDNEVKYSTMILYVSLPVITAVTMATDKTNYDIGNTIIPTLTATVNPTGIDAPDGGTLKSACTWTATPEEAVTIASGIFTAATASSSATLTCSLRPIAGFAMGVTNVTSPAFEIKAVQECGNGILEAGEGCDNDTTKINGDGCNDSCEVESGWTCTGSLGSISTCTQTPQCPALPAHAEWQAGNGQYPDCEWQCGSGYTLSGSVCELTLLVKCIGTNTYYDTVNGACWKIGTVNQSCNAACDALDGSVTGTGIDCAGGTWNVDSTICSRLNITTLQQLSTSDMTNSYAPYKMASYCKARNDSADYVPIGSIPLFKCDNIPGGSHVRICKCQ